MRRLLSGALISVTLISIILDQILNTPLATWAPMNEEYFIRVEISETVKNPRSDQISSLDPLITFRERSNVRTVSISDYTFHFTPVVSKSFGFFVNFAGVNFPHFTMLFLFRVNGDCRFPLNSRSFSNNLISWRVNFQ